MKKHQVLCTLCEERSAEYPVVLGYSGYCAKCWDEYLHEVAIEIGLIDDLRSENERCRHESTERS